MTKSVADLVFLTLYLLRNLMYMYIIWAYRRIHTLRISWTHEVTDEEVLLVVGR